MLGGEVSQGRQKLEISIDSVLATGSTYLHYRQDPDAADAWDRPAHGARRGNHGCVLRIEPATFFWFP